MNCRLPVVAVAICGMLAQTEASAVARSAPEARAPVRAKVKLELGERTGYEYQWEFGIMVHVTARTTGRPLARLHVVATGKMSVPGHSMQTPPTALRAAGPGIYVGKLAFYMPGDWRIVVSAKGASVVPSVTTFSIFLDPSDRAP